MTHGNLFFTTCGFVKIQSIFLFSKGLGHSHFYRNRVLISENCKFMKHNYVLNSLFFAWCINLGKTLLKKTYGIFELLTARLAQNCPKLYRCTWTRISVEPIGAFTRTILLAFTMTIACSSWITRNYNKIDIKVHCPLDLEDIKPIRTWHK